MVKWKALKKRPCFLSVPDDLAGSLGKDEGNHLCNFSLYSKEAIENLAISHFAFRLGCTHSNSCGRKEILSTNQQTRVSEEILILEHDGFLRQET